MIGVGPWGMRYKQAIGFPGNLWKERHFLGILFFKPAA